MRTGKVKFTRSQCIVSDTRVTVKASGPLVDLEYFIDVYDREREKEREMREKRKKVERQNIYDRERLKCSNCQYDKHNPPKKPRRV